MRVGHNEPYCITFGGSSEKKGLHNQRGFMTGHMGSRLFLESRKPNSLKLFMKSINTLRDETLYVTTHDTHVQLLSFEPPTTHSTQVSQLYFDS